MSTVSVISKATAVVTVPIVLAWLHDAAEVAFIDIREAGIYGEGHALLAVNIPYSRLELDAVVLVPRRATRIVLFGADDVVTDKAAAALRRQGYERVFVLQGGPDAWLAAGQKLFASVNVPSKAFAECVEQAYHTPDIGPAALADLQAQGADVVVLDYRTEAEFAQFHVPGAISSPGVELLARFADQVPSAQTLVVVSCAGRTRGIMGAQTLINAGVPNRVKALAGGTQGWRLAGLPLERDVPTGLDARPSDRARAWARDKAQHLAARFAVPFITGAELEQRRSAPELTTYVFDVRTRAEYEAGHAPGAVWCAGGQLIQCLDQWVAVRKAHVVLTDDDGARAIIAAHWLRQLGWEASVLDPDSAEARVTSPPCVAQPRLVDVPQVTATEAATLVGQGALFLDASPSADFRREHPQGARWCNRSVLGRFPRLAREAGTVIVTARDDRVAHLLALEFTSLAKTDVLAGGPAAWTVAGLPGASAPNVPSDAERIDHLFWLHDRHAGNAQASAAYLKWEGELPAMIGEPARAGFRLP